MPLDPPDGADPVTRRDQPSARDSPPGDPAEPHYGSETLATAGGLTSSAPSSVPDDGMPRRFGNYELLGLIGRGGMGVVWKAKLVGSDRLVALKQVLADEFASSEAVERFKAEARAAAGLDHPGIVPVYDIGEVGSRPYYTMALVAGGSLKDLLVNGPLPPGTAAELLQQLARAVQHAHDRGVIHRDLKPENILLQRDGLAGGKGAATASNARRLPTAGSTVNRELQAGEVMPRLTDFGLARAADSTAGGLTRTGTILGTPSYMAPEQAAGDGKRVGPQADVYGLGAVLYCCLTGRPPFQAATVLETLRQVQEQEPVPVRRLNPALPRDLETVCLKCLEKEPARRYDSAAALAEDLRRFANDEPILAVPAGPTIRFAKWVRRRPAIAGLLVAVVLVTIAGSMSFGWAYSEALRSLRAAREANRRRMLNQVEQLQTAAAPAVPGILQAIDDERDEALAPLHAAWQRDASDADRAAHMRLALALLPDQPELKNELAAWMLEATDPREMLLARDALKTQSASLTDDLWRRAADKKTPVAARFRALVALAAFDPGNPDWKDSGSTVVEQLLKANPLFLGVWTQALRPVAGSLTGPLSKVFRGKVQADKRQVAAEVLAVYGQDDPELLADLAADSDPEQFAVLVPLLERHREKVAKWLERELGRTVGRTWIDRSLDPNWSALEPATVRQIERATGLVTERFALVQALPLDRFKCTTETLRRAGYRPIRFRPYGNGDRLAVAAVWIRDGKEFEVITDALAEDVKRHDAVLREKGFLPVDVAGYLSPGGGPERYAGVWEKEPAGNARLAVGFPVSEFARAEQEARKEALGPICVHLLYRPGGPTLYSAVWRKGGEGEILGEQEESSYARPNAEFLRVDGAVIRQSERPERWLQELGLWMAGFADPGSAGGPWPGFGLHVARRALAAGDLTYASAWQRSTTKTAVEMHGPDPVAHLKRCRQLAADGFRPVALTVAAGAAGGIPIIASVWHRPLVAETDRVALARRQANAAAALLRLNQEQRAWSVLRHTPEPDARSYLVRDLASRGVEAGTLVKRLEEEQDVSARRAVILALGEYGEDQLPASSREPLVRKLLGLYRSDPDAGVHGAIDWLLRHGTEGPAARKLDWGQRATLAAIDQELAGKTPAARQDWYVTKSGSTMTVVPGPVEFTMGSPVGEVGRTPYEMQHRRRIGRSFAVAAKAVTVGQWKAFLRSGPSGTSTNQAENTPEDEFPITGVDWYEAGRYCRWLSEREEMDEREMCYPSSADIKERMKPFADYLKRTGYRLATEAEWEYACRSGSETARYYGADVDLLERYAWFQGNSAERMWPVGQKRPNDLGLFDLHGNAYTWVQNAFDDYPTNAQNSVRQDVEVIQEIRDSQIRVLRGGSFDYLPYVVRSAFRSGYRPSFHSDIDGLRVVRTYP